MANLWDLFSYSLRSLSHRRLRAYLTVLGIVIGVASVVTLMSISDGLYASINDQLSEFGARTVVVVPGGPDSISGISGGGYMRPTSGRLFEKDISRIERVIGVQDITKSVSFRTSLFYKKQNITLSLSGVEPSEYEKVRGEIKISEGRFLTDADKHVAVIGSNFASTEIFEQPMSVGSFFYVGPQRTKVRVVGILDSSSGKSNLIMPFDDVRELASKSLADNEVNSITFTVSQSYDFDSVTQQVKYNLASSRGVKEDDPDFTLVTADYILDQVDQLLGFLTGILGFIIGVSLVVGGVGVANTMFVSVLEKTKEIGTLKAIGATSTDVLLLILTESAIIGLMGGLIGLLLSFVITLIVALFDFTAIITLPVALFAMLFSVCVSMISGFFPALSASKLSPVVAMRAD